MDCSSEEDVSPVRDGYEDDPSHNMQEGTAGQFATGDGPKENGTYGFNPDVAALREYQLGDCLGKGAFGSVYRALNWGTGETVAIKKIRLADLPQHELKTIMSEIDLLKDLNHPNIVKYHGFKKSSDSLYIILEYCENGSLHSICKNFGKFPENLVALYMSQALSGLLYLHEQGVIHRDIKGANILTTKEGLVKLADFGVATNAGNMHEASVVGTPYWMAPEVIEMSGASTASDIWSLGCTVIELLEGRPPYHKLQPMPALFRIVNDDHPPLPTSASPIVVDFLMQCFQKNPNLRVSAKKLLKHPWIVKAKRTNAVEPTKPTEYGEAVKSVQQWNEALKSPGTTLHRPDPKSARASPIPTKIDHLAPSGISANGSTPTPTKGRYAKRGTDSFRSLDDLGRDNWDDDFASSIGSSALHLPHLQPVDKFGGILSSEKLKAYATIQTATEQDVWDNDFEDVPAVAGAHLLADIDPLETIRPPSPAKQLVVAKPERRFKIQRRIPSSKVAATAENPPAREGPVARPWPAKRLSSLFREDTKEDFSDLVPEKELALNERFQYPEAAEREQILSPKFAHMSDLRSGGSSLSAQSTDTVQASRRQIFADSTNPGRSEPVVGIHRYTENLDDEDFSDLFGTDGADGAVVQPKKSRSGQDVRSVSLSTPKFSSSSWSDDGENDENEDPFAQLEDDLDEVDMETKVAGDKHARLCAMVEGVTGFLKTNQAEEFLADISDQLLHLLSESPELKSVVISSHGLLPLLEVLDACQRRDVTLRLLRIINAIISDSIEIQETLCFVGGIPVVTKFAHKKYSREIRLEAASFVRQMYQTSTLTLQMFISTGGLNVLVEFLEEDFETERDLVLIGVDGVWSVFALQGPTPKNDFCRIFCRNSVLYPLSLVLSRVLDEQGEVASVFEGRIANIFMIFSQAENYVKESIANRMVLKRVLKDLGRMSPVPQVTMLKFIKNLSMLATTLDALQNSNAIEVLTDLLSSSMKLPHFRDMSNQILNTMYNLCRLSKTRQEDAALNGVIPLLQRIVQTDRPLKEFALPILCDMAHSGKVGRTILWQNKGLHFYITMLGDPYWQGTALDAILVWLQEETAKVEEHLLTQSFDKAIVKCFSQSKADAFEKLLDPLQKMLRLSPPIAAALAQPELFHRTGQKLQSKKAVVRGDLLRILRSICDASENETDLLRRYGLHDTIERLSSSDPAILVRNIASELLKSSEATTPNGGRRPPGGSGGSGDGQRGRPPPVFDLRRTSSSTGVATKLTPPFYTSHSSASLMSPQAPEPPTPFSRSSNRLPFSSSFSSTMSDYPTVTAAARGENRRVVQPQRFVTPAATPPATPAHVHVHAQAGRSQPMPSHQPPPTAFLNPAVSGRSRAPIPTIGTADNNNHSRPGTPSSVTSVTTSTTNTSARSGANPYGNGHARTDRPRQSNFSASTASTTNRASRSSRASSGAGIGSASPSTSTAATRARLAARHQDAAPNRSGSVRRDTLASPARSSAASGGTGNAGADGWSGSVNVGGKAVARMTVLARREKDREALAIARKRISRLGGGKSGVGTGGGAGGRGNGDDVDGGVGGEGVG